MTDVSGDDVLDAQMAAPVVALDIWSPVPSVPDTVAAEVHLDTEWVVLDNMIVAAAAPDTVIVRMAAVGAVGTACVAGTALDTAATAVGTAAVVADTDTVVADRQTYLQHTYSGQLQHMDPAQIASHPAQTQYHTAHHPPTAGSQNAA